MNRPTRSTTLTIAGLLLLTTASFGQRAKPRNVLFIMVDDLRPELGAYGHRMVKSPHIDRLAASSTRFTKAYCQQALCAPSRASMLTGLRPGTTKITRIDSTVRQYLPTETTLPQVFKEAGFETITIGKIYHHAEDDAQNWTRKPLPRSEWGYNGYASAELRELSKQRKAEAEQQKLSAMDVYKRSMVSSTKAAEVGDEAYADGNIAQTAVQQLQQLKQHPQKPAVSNALVECVDLFPTFTQACGLPDVPRREGMSLLPLIEQPNRPGKQAAYSQYPRGKGMGYSVTDGQWRYTEWANADGSLAAVELYDHRQTKTAFENVAGKPDLAATQTRLKQLLDTIQLKPTAPVENVSR